MLCQTLSEDLDKSRKTARISKEQLASKQVKALCVIAINGWIQESPGLKFDWLTISRQF